MSKETRTCLITYFTNENWFQNGLSWLSSLSLVRDNEDLYIFHSGLKSKIVNFLQSIFEANLLFIEPGSDIIRELLDEKYNFEEYNKVIYCAENCYFQTSLSEIGPCFGSEFFDLTIDTNGFPPSSLEGIIKATKETGAHSDFLLLDKDQFSTLKGYFKFLGNYGFSRLENLVLVNLMSYYYGPKVCDKTCKNVSYYLEKTPSGTLFDGNLIPVVRVHYRPSEFEFRDVYPDIYEYWLNQYSGPKIKFHAKQKNQKSES